MPSSKSVSPIGRTARRAYCDGLSDDDIRAILSRVKTFAVVGASPKPDRPSYDVMRFLIEEGYVVKPINPGIAGKTIHDQLVYASLAEVLPPVDVVDIFRASDAVPGIVHEANRPEGAIRDKRDLDATRHRQ